MGFRRIFTSDFAVNDVFWPKLTVIVRQSLVHGSRIVFEVRRRPMSVLPVSPKPGVFCSVETVANRGVICILRSYRKSMAASLNIRVTPYFHFRFV